MGPRSHASDTLEELVGLDISYHGGSTLNIDESRAAEFEYVEAFRKRQGLRNRKRKNLEEEKTEAVGVEEVETS
jgi:hypothetical protein